MDDEQRVAAIRERAEAATEGPWEVEDEMVWEGEYRQPSALVAKTRPDVEGGSNAQFIAAAREDIPWLLDRLRAAEAELATSRELTGAWRGSAGQNRLEFEAMRAAASASEARASEAEAVIAEALTMLWRHGLRGGWEAAGAEAKAILGRHRKVE